ERRNGDFVRALIAAGRVSCCHDLSDGGLYVALAEMAIAGGVGADLAGPEDDAWLFGEDQARYLLAVEAAETGAVLAEAEAAGVPAQRVGTTGGVALTRSGADAISVGELRSLHASWLPAYMARA
ncbi:MAG TPA: AIR synthase-related protein, partial [Alphaproteobacteria bacterium]